VYAARPAVTAGVWVWAAGYGAAALWRSGMRASRPMRRRASQAWHGSAGDLARRKRRANRTIGRTLRGVGSAAKRAVRKNA
jgi:hypothetical protein